MRKGSHHSLEARKKMSESKKGHSVSQETRRKISKANMGNQNGQYHKGRICSKETIRKMSLAAKERFKNPANHPRYGVHLSEETKRKISLHHKKYYKNPENHGMYGKHHSVEAKQKMREKRLQYVFPIKDTSIEIVLREELDRRGIEYETHCPVCGICQPDIVFSESKIAVFADGDYWHSKEFKDGKVWERDRKQDMILEQNGWKVLRFWGSEINENAEKCINKIMLNLNGLAR